MIKKQKSNAKVPGKTNSANKSSSKDGGVNPSTSGGASKQYKKTSEYGRQLAEKQRVKRMYGLREKQFKLTFQRAEKAKGATGKVLLTLLESRLDNIVYRLKFSTTRRQARQMVVHGHFTVNGARVYSPSMTLDVNDVIELREKAKENKKFLDEVVEKPMAAGQKVPGWLELDKSQYLGRILRLPVREDIQATINENFIVELYSKN